MIRSRSDGGAGPRPARTVQCSLLNDCRTETSRRTVLRFGRLLVRCNAVAEVSLQHVTKTFDGKVRAVDDLSLTVPDGRLLVLVGPSGCGKSTTLRMIAGLERATSGDIRIGDRTVNNVHPKDRDVAMVFQNYALYPHMTVARNMGFALRNRKVPKDEIRTRVAETAEALGITDLLERRPGALSGGQQQRVALGRAIVRNPAVFLFDEPLSNLDAQLRLRMRAEIRSLQQRLRTTSIYVTHDQEEAMTLGDEIVVMEGGRMQQMGPPLDVYAAPANRFVASFIGSPTMNFLEGRVESGGEFVETGGGAIALPPTLGPLADTPCDLTLGVRPQALSLVNGAGASGPAIDVRVDVVEPLGDVMDVVGRTAAGTTIVARIPARTDVASGHDVRFAIDPAKLHLFEPGSMGARRNGAAT
jgi:multiple sugar transport system ATP-binding protein